jgi:tRNA (guanine26-N2/guanine27-N2)-dimethyltransferase
VVKLSFPFPVEIACEGSAQVLVPRLEAFVETPSDYAPSKAPVFYNPVMEKNRDFAVLALQVFQNSVGRRLRACEPLTGCGIRGIRLAKEVRDVQQVVINDINNEAFQLAQFNVEKNLLKRIVCAENEDANLLLSRFGAPRKRFDYIDIDPFGSPMPYVDSALRALRSGGLIALTATDLAPLCGVHPKACIRKYGGRPLRTEYCHELAVRLLAGALARSAARYDNSIMILFSYGSQHYIRLYATIHHGARKANSSIMNMGYIKHCFSCFHREASPGIFKVTVENCPECKGAMDFAGPLWIDKIVDEDFVALLEKEARMRDLRHMRNIRRQLSLTKQEAKAPFAYYVVDKICDKIGLPIPSKGDIIAELEKGGYIANSTYYSHHGIKTDASAKTVAKTIRELSK